MEQLMQGANSSTNITTSGPGGLVTATSPSPGSVTAPPATDDAAWPAPRIFVVCVATLYGILSVLTLVFFARKLSQICRRMKDMESRLLADPTDSESGVGGAASANQHRRGGAAIEGSRAPPYAGPLGPQQQSEEFKSRNVSGSSKRGNFAGVRNSVVDDSDDSGVLPASHSRTGSALSSNIQSRSGGGGPTMSDVIVEVRSSHHASDGSVTEAVVDGERPRYSSRHHVQGTCARCCEMICDPIRNCFAHICCLPSSYFADRNRSSVLLLGSMFAYATARCAEVSLNAVKFDDNYKNGRAGASTLYQTVLTSIPASFLLLLQLAFNLKWVVNVRNISASGAGPEDSRLSLGPTRSALDYSRAWRGRNNNNNNNVENDDDGPCSCDIGTTALTVGMFFVMIFPIFGVLGLLAYLDKEGDLNPSSGTHVETFLGASDVAWMRIITGVAAAPFVVNGFCTIFLGIVLRAVWKPFSDVAITASLHMFVVAIVWGSLCMMRGILLLSFDFNALDKDTKSPWAGPGTLFGEGILIYTVIFVFYLSSRNQDQVVAAEREAKFRAARGLPIGNSRGGRGGGNAGGGRSGGGGDAGGSGGASGGASGSLRGSQSALRLGDRGGGGGAGMRSSDQLGLPVYSTWSSHSQTPSRAVSENFGPGADGAGPSQSRLFYGDDQ